MERYLTPGELDLLQQELDLLDKEQVDIEGVRLKPSQCYRFETDPAHVMFNTNCPDTLRKKVEAILAKYIHPDEDSALQ